MTDRPARRVLTTRDLNRALLARQLLLERSSLSIPRAVERLGGLQNQYAPSGYVSLWSRVRDFRRGALTRALERRRVVQATLLRGTIHVVSARDYPLFAEGIRTSLQTWWLRIHKDVTAGGVEAAAARVREFLSGEPRRASEIKAFMSAEGFPREAWSSLGVWLDLVRVPPSGTWEHRRADLYGRADEWLGPSAATEARGLDRLVRRYFGAFGPASPNDVAGWAGVPVRLIHSVIEEMDLRRFRDEAGGDLFDLPRAMLPEPDTRAPVRFLPTWDATLLVHARRAQILPEPYRPLVFNTRTPHSVPTFLVEGAVAGTWRHEGGHIRIEPFEVLPRMIRREVEAEATGLAAFHA
jgi:hypothetical protein